MKKQLFLLLILTALSIRLTAQERLLFKPFSPFNKDITERNDTAVYIEEEEELSKPKSKLPYKPFSVFQQDTTLMNDTIAYLDYNFGKEGRGVYYYSGRTVADVIQDLELPIKAAGRISTVGRMGLSGLTLHLSDLDYTLLENRNSSINITVYFKERIPSDSAKVVFKKYPLTQWCSAHYELVKNSIVYSTSSHNQRKSYLEFLWKRNRKQSDIPFLAPSDTTWKRELKEAKTGIKQKINEAIKKGKIRNSNLSLTAINTTNLIPVEIFDMPAITFSFMFLYSIVNENIFPNTTEGGFFISDGKEIKGISNAVYKDNVWEQVSYTPFEGNYAKTLSSVLLDKKHPVYVIKIEVNQQGTEHKRYIVFTENDEYKVIREDGSVDYFTDEIVRLKREKGVISGFRVN